MYVLVVKIESYIKNEYMHNFNVPVIKHGSIIFLMTVIAIYTCTCTAATNCLALMHYFLLFGLIFFLAALFI